MSTAPLLRQEDFTAEQWLLLLDTPALVGAATMISSRSGLGTVKEAFALTRGLLDVPRTYETNELIQAVVEARRAGSGAREWTERYGSADAHEVESEAVSRCAQISRLLADANSTRETDEFKAWIYSIGMRVAQASSEGGFLGLGGKRISDEEEQFLARIAAALEIEPA